MKKHTIAPWELKSENCVVGRNKHGLPETVAQIFNIVPYDSGKTAANANLICAAPVLYQVCCDVLKFLSNPSETTDCVFEQIKNRKAFCKMLQYAVALADNGKGICSNFTGQARTRQRKQNENI